MQYRAPEHKVDILLVGGGVMSATLATLLVQLAPELEIVLLEKMAEVATESSAAWNNAGTGHAGYCELNYTPRTVDGSIDIKRALRINAAYEVSLQFWSSLVEQGLLATPESFINVTPHQSFVWGADEVAFLRARHARLQQHHLFSDMQYSEDGATIARWMPLVMQQRPAQQTVAATHVAYGTDVDFGALTRQLLAGLQRHTNFDLQTRQLVQGLRQDSRGRWQVVAKDTVSGRSKTLSAGFVFLGAGGGALPLLQKSAVSESRGYGGFPVSGCWLVCKNQAVVQQHHSKVYGKAPLGAPPMSVPHLDSRHIAGEPALLFGPYAGFSSKFLKSGSYFDLLQSIKASNLRSMLGVARHNFALTRYLVGEVLQNHEARMAALRRYYPQARAEDWELAIAGQRVQIIKPSSTLGGKLEFGTEIVTSADGSLAALLGASPGASVAVQTMLHLLQRCFPQQLASASWQSRLQMLIPSYGAALEEDAALLHQVRRHTLEVLQLG